MFKDTSFKVRALYAVFGALILAIMFSIWYLFSTIWITLPHTIFAAFMRGPVIVIFLVLSAAAGVTSAVIYNKHYDRYSYNSNAPITFKVSLTATIIFILGIIVSAFFQSYWNDQAILNNTEVVYENNASEVSYEGRVPLEVAKAVSARSLGDSTGDMIDTLKSNPAEGTYSTAIVRRGLFQGYESIVEMKLPKYGTFTFDKDIKTCEFSPEAKRRFDGGGFNNALTYKMIQALPGWNPSARIFDEDVFMFCNDETPMIYAPVIKTKISFPGAYDYQAGVVSYNGKTGDIKYFSNLENNDFPVYSISIAKNQREALNANNGYINWLMNRSGYETTSKDEEDVNKNNSTEFTLINSEHQMNYVTPLTPRGSSSAIVALSEVSSNSFTSGKLNKLVVRKYETPKQAPSTIAETIVSSVLSGYKASGLTVFEVVPSENGSWTATIGKNQSILYRAVINNSDSITLYDKNGDVITNNVKLNDSGDVTEENNDSSLSSKPIEQMTGDELKELMNQITSELVNRAENNEGN